MSKRVVSNLLLVMLVLGFTAVVIQAAPTAQTFNSPLVTPGSFSPLPTPMLCPASTRWATLVVEMTVEGLRGADVIQVQLLPDTLQTAACLPAHRTEYLELTVRNGNHIITLPDVPDGFYRLVVLAPLDYFREPQGYLFQVLQGQIVRGSDLPLHFELIPPSEQGLPPCRDFVARSDSSRTLAEDSASEPQVVCRAERLIDISSPPKQPEPQEEGSNVLDVGYHYVGPMTSHDNQGVWGRNYVVNPGVNHGGVTQFVCERVYASRGSGWMEAGWVEHSSRSDRQYIYEYDSATNTWNYFDQYVLSTGSPVRTRVWYEGLGYWRADLYWNGSYHELAREFLGFGTADYGYNRGEIYTADGTHPVLPISGFDMGYLFDGLVWNVWDAQYSTLTAVGEDAPYECDMVNQYYRFNIHSPVVFLSLIMKEW